MSYYNGSFGNEPAARAEDELPRFDASTFGERAAEYAANTDTIHASLVKFLHLNVVSTVRGVYHKLHQVYNLCTQTPPYQACEKMHEWCVAVLEAAAG